MTKEENQKRLAYLKNIVSNLPNKPGTYQFYDKEHTIIYVGKAKNLKSVVLLPQRNRPLQDESVGF